MQSRASFPTVASEFLHGTAANTIDTGFIPTPVTSTQTSGPANRGVESNTARGVKGTPEIGGITKIEYGSSADQPEVVGFRTYGEN